MIIDSINSFFVFDENRFGKSRNQTTNPKKEKNLWRKLYLQNIEMLSSIYKKYHLSLIFTKVELFRIKNSLDFNAEKQQFICNRKLKGIFANTYYNNFGKKINKILLLNNSFFTNSACKVLKDILENLKGKDEKAKDSRLDNYKFALKLIEKDQMVYTFVIYESTFREFKLIDKIDLLILAQE